MCLPVCIDSTWDTTVWRPNAILSPLTQDMRPHTLMNTCMYGVAD
jgi:hypothetical protein